MNHSTPGLPVHHHLPEFTQTHVHRVGDAIQPSHPLSSPSPPAPNPSQHHSLFQWVNSHWRWPKYWSFSFTIIPSKEHPGLISFRMDWLHLLAVQGTLKSLLQHHSSKASILRHSAFFTVQLSHKYMTTGKTIALTRRTFVGKVISLLLNMLSRLVITFLPRSKRLLIFLTWISSQGFSWHVCMLVGPYLSWSEICLRALSVGRSSYRPQTFIVETARVENLSPSCHGDEYPALRTELFITFTFRNSCSSSGPLPMALQPLSDLA